MKRLIPFLIFFFISSSIWCQFNYRALSFKFGYYGPKDVPNSMIFGCNYTFRLGGDQEIGMAIEYLNYNKQYEFTIDKNNSIGLITETEIATVAESNIHLIPISFIYIIRLPVLQQ